MKDKQWAATDLNILIDSYKSVDVNELAFRLDRTVNSIRLKAKELGLTTIKSVGYSAEEDEFILENAKNLPIQEIADNLGRTKTAVNKRLFFLRKRKLPNFNNEYGVIENDVKINANISEMLRVTLLKLEIGQSFVFEKRHYTQLRIETGQMKPKIFETKSIDDLTSRCWRTF